MKDLAVSARIIRARNCPWETCVCSHSGSSDKSQKEYGSPGFLLVSHLQQNWLNLQDRVKSKKFTCHSQSPRSSATENLMVWPPTSIPLKHRHSDSTIGATNGLNVAGPRDMSCSTENSNHRDIRELFGLHNITLRNTAIIFFPSWSILCPIPIQPQWQMLTIWGNIFPRAIIPFGMFPKFVHRLILNDHPKCSKQIGKDVLWQEHW